MKDPSPGRGRLSTIRQLAGGCGTWWVRWWGSGDGTLLGPEGSGPDRPGDGVVRSWFFLVSPLSRSSLVWGGWGVGGLAPCDLNSGREHLVSDLHQDPAHISDMLSRWWSV